MLSLYEQAIEPLKAFLKERSLEKIIDFNDLHLPNMYANLYGGPFGLRKAGAENDAAALSDPLIQFFISYFLKGPVESIFWEKHQLEDCTKTLREAFGTAQVPKPEFYDFWNQWIDRQQIEKAAKDTLIDELSNAQLYGQPLERNGRLNSRFIKLMLFDMGIAEKADI